MIALLFFFLIVGVALLALVATVVAKAIKNRVVNNVSAPARPATTTNSNWLKANWMSLLGVGMIITIFTILAPGTIAWMREIPGLLFGLILLIILGFLVFQDGDPKKIRQAIWRGGLLAFAIGAGVAIYNSPEGKAWSQWFDSVKAEAKASAKNRELAEIGGKVIVITAPTDGWSEEVQLPLNMWKHMEAIPDETNEWVMKTKDGKELKNSDLSFISREEARKMDLSQVSFRSLTSEPLKIKIVLTPKQYQG